MKRTLIHLHRSFWLTLTLLLILLAVFLSVARLLTPYVVQERPEVERIVSVVLGRPVHIGHLQVSWDHFTPALKGTQVVIYDQTNTHPVLTVDELDVSVNIVDSVFSGRLQIDQLTISGAKITLRQAADGSVVLSGFGAVYSQIGQGENLDASMSWLLAAPRLSLRQIALDWYGKNGQHIVATDLDLNLRNQRRLHTLWGQTRLVQTIPTQLKFIVQLGGDWQQKQTLKIRGYLDANNLVVEQWFADHPFGNFTLQKGLLNVRLWTRWEQGQWQNIQTLFTVKNVTILKANVSAPLNIAQGTGHLVWQQKNSNWNLDAQINDLAMARWQKIPGITGLSAFLHFSPNDGFAELASKQMFIDFGTLFRAPLSLQQIAGQVSWQRTSEGWLLQTKNLLVKASDAVAESNFSLLFPTDGTSPVISLLAGFHMQGREHLADYLPIGILSKGLVNWLETSIVRSGNLQSTIVLRGPLHSFPFDDNDGVFIADAQITDMDLNFWPEWPTLTHVKGELIFKNRSMQMQIDDGKIYSTPIKNIQAAIPLIKKGIPAILHVDGQLASNLNDGLRLLQETPLHKGRLSSVNGMQGQGPLQLQLHIAIPVEHVDVPTTVNGEAILDRGQLNIPAHNLQLTDLSGKLNFTQDSLSAEKLSGKFANKPLTINIATVQQKPVIKIHYEDIAAILSGAEKNRWQLALQSPNFEGQITIPSDKYTPLEAVFQRVYIQPNGTQDFNKIKPTDLPAINLVANEVQYGNKKFGQVQLRLTPIPGGLQITSLTASSGAFNLQANGTWTQTRGNNVTQLNGQLTSNDLASALIGWGFPAAIKSNQTQLQFALTWPGPAFDPDFKTMNGNLTLYLAQGEIVNVGQSEALMDIGRLLSVMSLESLERRLKLDFSDLTSKGFSFDSWNGTFSLRNGNAYTQNNYIKGPMADIEISGRIGLGDEDYDLLINVTPKITSTLPLIVGLATGPVGPIAGAATWVASKIFSKAVDKIATDSYRMTGPWSNPTTSPAGSFLHPGNSGKK